MSCCKEKPEERPRTIVLHQTHNEDGKPLFISNRIKTTKYTILTFLPKNLFEQFCRIANFYFLVIACLLQFPWAPISATVAIVPLAIVVGISAIREAVEDILRWKSDSAINGSLGHRLSNGAFIDCRLDEICVGDVIEVRKNEQIPADIVILASDEAESLAYIDTCNLDGETNLKIRQALPQTNNFKIPEACQNFNCKIVCDVPNNLLYTFNGYLETEESQYPLENKQVLLRGCVLRNTQYVYGAVVYTGLQTKLMMNSSAARSKRSRIERGLNMKILSVFIFLLVCGLVGASCGLVFERDKIDTGKHWYFFRNHSNRRNLVSVFFILMVSHIVIINAIIPISLYVTLEIVRVFQALFVRWDAQMYDLETETPAVARTSNISDDLGQIEYIFSDKTGTLTRNVMEFMKCSIGEAKFGSGTTEVAYAAAKRRGETIDPPDPTGKAFKDESFMKLLENPPDEVRDYLWLLAVCHAVIAEPDDTKPHGYVYEASSPDEGALVLAAADFGYKFTGRTTSSLIVVRNGEKIEVPVLANLEFSSERKRSSVVIKHPDTGKIVLFCKGADDKIFELLAKDSQHTTVTLDYLKEFAANGLRTLCCAYRELEEADFNAWKEKFVTANCSVENREADVAEVCAELERDLYLLGTTAIEDKLQIGVPETIESLLRAGINVWVITGDKRETAINIGYACSLLTSEMKLVVMDDQSNEEIDSIVDDMIPAEGKFALVASGAALYHLLSEENKDKFYKLSQKCQSVICCRVSPLQKATIVALMREMTGKLALAIGDGANDVGMILQADVGVGISGKEGRQAVLSSDYSFAQFRYLRRLLLVHGRLNFYRNVNLINYSFYKNMAFSLNQIIFAFFSSFSGNTMYDSILYTVFNVIFTSVPPVIYAGLEKDIPLSRMEIIPELYSFDGRRGYLQGYLRFWMFLLLGVFHAFVSFFIPYFGFNQQFANGKIGGLTEFSSTVYGAIVCIVNLQMAIMCQNWTWWHFVFIIASVLIYPLIVLLIDVMHISMRGRAIQLMRSSSFYFNIIACSAFAFMCSLIFHAVVNSLDTMQNRVRELERRSGRQVEQMDEPPPQDEASSDEGSELSLASVSASTQSLKYPDASNETGYAFEPPLALAPSTFTATGERPSSANSLEVTVQMMKKTFTLSKQGLDDL